MEQQQRYYERNMRKWDRQRRIKAAAGLDTTKEDYWYKYHQQHLKALVKNSGGFLKRDYAAEKIGGTKGRPYKPVRKSKKQLEYTEIYKEESHRSINRKSTIDRSYIESNAYRNRFSGLHESEKLTKSIARESVQILKHRQGTLNEDLVYIHSETGKVLRNRAYPTEQKTMPTLKMKNFVLDNPGKIIAIHNHPLSSVPSFSDLKNAQRYKYGLAVGHNGVIYKYTVTPGVVLDEHRVNTYLEILEKSLYTDVREVNIDTKELEKALKRFENEGIKLEVLT